jgi:ribosomal protein S18 acetylase RimI-like enzyme
MMSIKIIKANINDAEKISFIGKISFTDAFGQVFEKNNLDSYLQFVYKPEKVAVSIRKENNVYFLAIADNKPVGFAKVKKFSLNEDIQSGAQMQLQKIYVLPEYHSSGAGTALLNEVLNLANEINPDYIWLDVYEGNKKAIQFYERNGFTKGSSCQLGIGAQSFEFYMMMLPVATPESILCY